MIAEYLINRAKRTPYSHIGDYMERYWLVPYSGRVDRPGCGPVRFLKRPIAWVLQKMRIAVRVHVIKTSDPAGKYHNHPWPFLTIPLRNGYLEYRPDRPVKYVRAGRPQFRGREVRHRIALGRDWQLNLIPAVTLFITFGTGGEWGFSN